jgi:hypothetical protein
MLDRPSECPACGHLTMEARTFTAGLNPNRNEWTYSCDLGHAPHIWTDAEHADGFCRHAGVWL